MAVKGTAAATGRRSHTKSRRGCKTCKQRHIRCDETFPHCNNCKKHEVACDYLEAVSPRPDEPGMMMVSSEVASAMPIFQTSGDGHADYSWPQMQSQPSDSELNFSFVAMLPSQAQMSPSDLHYHHHLDSICDNMSMKGVTDLTLWTSSLPRFLNIASTHPSVMNALLSFSANHVAWITKSADVRRLSFEYGSLALSGLHDAIGSFSKENSDAALAASMILVCQATDWRSWSSLETGIRSVTAAMEPWKHESVLADITEAKLSRKAQEFDAQPRDPSERSHVMIDTIAALSHLQCYLPAGLLEHDWVGQLVDYVRRLQTSESVLIPQVQFEHLYTLRKWTYWVPVQLLDQGSNVSINSLLALAYLYTTALQIGPLYRDIGHRFFGLNVVEALDRCLWRIENMSLDTPTRDLAALLQYPRKALAAFKSHDEGSASLHVSPVMGAINDMSWFTGLDSMGDRSPCFTQMQPNFDPRRISGSSARSSMLEVPTPSYAQPQLDGFTQNLGQWGTVPSPNFLSQDFMANSQEPLIYDSQFDLASEDLTGGCVPLKIWT